MPANNIYNLLEIVTFTYVFISLVRAIIQYIYAHLNYLQQNHDNPIHYKALKQKLDETVFPKVSVIFPIFDEDPEVLDKVMDSAIECLSIPNIEIIFVDDGSSNFELIRHIYVKGYNQGIKFIRKPNSGKREAQYVGFNNATGDYIITVDSDTIINRLGIFWLVAEIESDSKIGSVTGDVQVINANTNLLTKLTEIRYWYAFHLERAAQSFNNSMMCNSGPFSIYRKESIDKVKEQYVNQYFFGKKCTYGDDRHLTNLIFSEGYITRFQKEARVYTQVPDNILTYVSQQTRWSKSFYREFLWTLKYWYNIPIYGLIDTMIQPFLFLMYALSLVVLFYSFFQTGDVLTFVAYLLILIGVSFVKILFGLILSKKPSHLLFVFYGFLHILFVIPARFKGLLTINDTNWGTRGVNKSNPYVNYIKWTLGFWLSIISAALGLFYLQNGTLPDYKLLNFNYSQTTYSIFSSLIVASNFFFVAIFIALVFLLITWITKLISGHFYSFRTTTGYLILTSSLVAMIVVFSAYQSNLIYSNLSRYNLNPPRITITIE